MSKETLNSTPQATLTAPSIVLGVLLALKYAGLTTLTYWNIICFSVTVWAAMAVIAVVIWLIFLLIGLLTIK